MSWTDVEGKTYEEAVATLLNSLGADRSEVELEHLGVHHKFLGFGKAVVKVRGRLKRESFEDKPDKTKKRPAVEPVVEADPEQMQTAKNARGFLEEIVKNIGIENAAVKVVPRESGVTLDIISDSGGLIIGRKGETLEALQMIMEIYAHRQPGKRVSLVVDTENYRSRRKDKLADIARNSADQAVDKKGKVYLGPMKSSERKYIHSCLQSDKRVNTKSEGEGDRRQVVVIPVG